MRARVIATVVVAASLLLSTTGCTFFAVNSTLKHYDPSDGVGTTVGSVKVANAMLLSSDGQLASFLVNFINEGSEPVTVLVQYESTTGGVAQKVNTSIALEPNQVRSYGAASAPKLIFTNIDTKAGGNLPVFVQYGTNTGVQLKVPVLDGSLEEYSKLVPTESPKPSTLPPVNPTVIPIPPLATPSPSPSASSQ